MVQRMAPFRLATKAIRSTNIGKSVSAIEGEHRRSIIPPPLLSPCSLACGPYGALRLLMLAKEGRSSTLVACLPVIADGVLGTG